MLSGAVNTCGQKLAQTVGSGGGPTASPPCQQRGFPKRVCGIDQLQTGAFKTEVGNVILLTGSSSETVAPPPGWSEIFTVPPWA